MRLGRYVDNQRHRQSKLFLVTKRGDAALLTIREAHDEGVEAIETEASGINWAALCDDLGHLVRVLQARRQRPPR